MWEPYRPAPTPPVETQIRIVGDAVRQRDRARVMHAVREAELALNTPAFLTLARHAHKLAKQFDDAYGGRILSEYRS